jgi:hypothetical protein
MKNGSTLVLLNAATLATTFLVTESALSLTCIRQLNLLTAKGSARLGLRRFRFDRYISLRALRTGTARYVVSPNPQTNADIRNSKRWASIKGICRQA